MSRWAAILKLVDGSYQEQAVLGVDGTAAITDPAPLRFALADLLD